MAAFCYQCTKRYFPEAKPEVNDMTHGQPDQVIYDVCEGCGPGYFDHEGKRREPDDSPTLRQNET
jgi:hypothetical protein